jgi:predicted transcriptional regulator YdeE
MRFACLSSILAFFVLVAVALSQSSAPKLVHQDEFSVAGIEVRTSGERELSDEGLIAGLWQKFYQDHVLDKVPKRADQNIYVLYTSYARDRMGEYTVVIGVRVQDKSAAPAGMVLKTVPAGQYAVVPSEKGIAATVIPDAWQRVWAFEDKDLLGGKRAYKTDFELYGPQATDPQNLQADLYVGLK